MKSKKNRTMKTFEEIYRDAAVRNGCNAGKTFARVMFEEGMYKPQNKMFHFCKTFCSKITLVNTIQNVILNPI